MNAIRVFFLPLLISISSCVICAQSVKTKKKPNVVFFLVDDLGWTDIEPYGTPFYETPNLKNLASESMLFTNAYAACPVCSPTRISIMTGKYPSRLQTTDYFGALQPDEIVKDSIRRTQHQMLPAPYRANLPLEEETIAEALKNSGYKTFIAGKWHLGKTQEYWPENQGFDINIGGFNSGHPKSYFSPYSNAKLEDGPTGEYLTDRLADETVKFIDENKEKPFFIYSAFYAVHTPLQGKKDLIEKYEEKKARLGLIDKFSTEGKSSVRMNHGNVIYAAMVDAMDEAVGKVIKKLKDERIYDNTIIIFFSDNGGESTAEGDPTSNFPLRAGKGWMYEGGIREPLLIRWPNHTKKGSICEQPVISTDFYPSILEMAGLPLLPEQHKDGKSIVPILEGKKIERSALFWHYPHYGNQGGAPGSAIRDGDWKLIRWYEDNREELYNLKEDIREGKNVLNEKPEIAEKLRNKLNKWLKEQDAKMPSPNPYYNVLK